MNPVEQAIEAMEALVEYAEAAGFDWSLDNARTAIAALRSMPEAEPYAYTVYFPDQQTEELVQDLDDLLEAMTNCEHTVTPHSATPLTAPVLMKQPLFVFAQEVIMGAWKPEELPEQAHRAMSAHRRMAMGWGDPQKQLVTVRLPTLTPKQAAEVSWQLTEATVEAGRDDDVQPLLLVGEAATPHTAPVPLSDEQIDAIFNKLHNPQETPWVNWRRFARAFLGRGGKR